MFINPKEKLNSRIMMKNIDAIIMAQDDINRKNKKIFCYGVILGSFIIELINYFFINI
jgi:hypothetical protein